MLRNEFIGEKKHENDRERVDGQQTPLFGFAFHGSCP